MSLRFRSIACSVRLLAYWHFGYYWVDVMFWACGSHDVFVTTMHFGVWFIIGFLSLVLRDLEPICIVLLFNSVLLSLKLKPDSFVALLFINALLSLYMEPKCFVFLLFIVVILSLNLVPNYFLSYYLSLSSDVFCVCHPRILRISLLCSSY